MYGDTLLVIGDWETANNAFRKAIELKGDEASPHYGRAVALINLGRDAEADNEIGTASAISPDWPESILASARSVILNERTRASPDACRSALNWAKLGIRVMEKPQPVHWDTVGLCYAAVGDFQKAAEQSHMALLESPTGPWGAVHRDRLRYYKEKRVPWE